MPEAESDIWIKWGVNIFAPPVSGDSGDQPVADALVAYVAAQTDAAETLPPDSLFGVLARARLGGERPLTREERMGFAHTAFAGGRDTIIGMITGIVALFAHHPEVRDAIARDPELARSATEEVVRLVSPLRVLTRVCPHGGTIDGVPVAKDQRIALCFGVASHDPAVFEDPDQFRIDRRPNPHLSFGAGPHTCLGNAHARLIARELMIELARRVRRIDIVEAIPEAEDAPYDVPGLRFKRLVVRARA
jgi:cytochrome P450